MTSAQPDGTRVVLYAEDHTNLFNFIEGTVQLEDETWMTGESLQESFNLMANGKTPAIRAELDQLTELFRRAAEYKANTLENVPIWFEWNIAGEPPRRTLVTGGSKRFLSGTGISPLLPTNQAKLRATMQKEFDYYEGVDQGFIFETGVKVLGGQIITETDGNLPARIKEFYIEQDIAGSGTENRVWVGFRKEYNGVDNFEPVWQCSLGTLGVDASLVADTDTLSGNAVSVSFATATEQERLRIGYFQIVGSNYAELRGRYKVLLRFKLTNTSTFCTVSVGQSFYWATTQAMNTQRIIGGAGSNLMHYVDLGEVEFPPAGARDFFVQGQLQQASLHIRASRLSGLGQLRLGEIVLIPTDHLLYDDRTTITNTPTIGTYNLGTHPDNNVYAYSQQGAGDHLPGNPAPSNFAIPNGKGIMVLAADNANGAGKTTDLTVRIKYHLRWKDYAR